MEINWSVFDGAIGLLLIGVVIWVALKLAKRIIIGILAIIIIGVLFFGWHIGGFGRAPADESRAEDTASP
jgi:hypothetical protein